MTRAALVLLGSLVAAVVALPAQAPLAFEVASVKLTQSSDASTVLQFLPGGRVTLRGVPLRNVITWAVPASS